MPIERFPDPREAGPDGLLALGGDLHPESLLLAYRQGIFPWPMEGLPLPWFCPEERGVLFFNELHVPRSLERDRKRSTLRFSVDEAFDAVIDGCAESERPGQDGTWITPELEKAYRRFHRAGHAHSVEAWDGRALVAGVYGVDAGGAFAAESMFHAQPNASKLALLFLIEHLRGRGLEWMDIQVMTPHMERLGARMIGRDEFLELLEGTLKKRRTLFEKR